MTRRLVNAMRQPVFKIWGHALGRLILRRDPFACRVEEVLDAVAESRAAIEINGDPYRLDLAPEWAQAARARGIRFVISTDAHSTGGAAQPALRRAHRAARLDPPRRGAQRALRRRVRARRAPGAVIDPRKRWCATATTESSTDSPTRRGAGRSSTRATPSASACGTSASPRCCRQARACSISAAAMASCTWRISASRAVSAPSVSICRTRQAVRAHARCPGAVVSRATWPRSILPTGAFDAVLFRITRSGTCRGRSTRPCSRACVGGSRRRRDAA